MNTRNIVLFLTLTLWPVFGSAQITLDEDQRERIDAVFAAHDTDETPGCALGIMSGGGLIYARGYGMANLSQNVPISTGSIFDVASISKQFTAATIVRLAQQGRLRLHDDIRLYLPEMPDYGTPITINHLLWHTSGLRDYTVGFLLEGIDYDEITTAAQALDFATRQQKLSFAPGSKYEYSNTGYVLLATIAERVTAQTFNQATRELLFNPLNMPLAVFRDRHDQVIPNVALGYAQKTPGQFAISMSNWEQVGDGALHLNIEETQKWDENFFTGQLGGPEFLEEMLRTGRLNDGRKLIYARGLQVDAYRGLRRVRHGGDWVGYHGNIERFPDQHTTVALLCNSDNIDQYGLSREVIDIALEDVFPQPKPVEPPPAPSLPLDRFTGTYLADSINEVYRVSAVDGRLVFSFLYIAVPLTSLGPTTFTIDGITGSRVEFLVNGSAPAHGLQWSLLGAEEPDGLPIPADRFTPVTAGNPNQYAGTFRSAEIDSEWELAVQGGVLQVKKAPATAVLPIAGALSAADAPDTFHGPAGYLRFTRNASGQVNGFDLTFFRILDIRFERVP